MKFTFAIIKKNQILAVAVVLMLIVAGYLNYTYNPIGVFDVELTGKIDDNLGDAVFVNSKNIETNINDLITDISTGLSTETHVEQTKNAEEYFIKTKLERANLWAEQLETYEKILKDDKVPQNQKDNAQIEIKYLNDLKNAVSITENLLKMKNFADAVILVNKNSVNVVIRSDTELTQTEVAQIQNIVGRELNAEIGDIHIMTK